MVSMRLTVGAHVGRYELLEEIGRGGMAVVFRAYDPNLEREVALKVMHAHLWGDEEHARRFEREARAAAALHHPNVIEVFDYGRVELETGAVGYLVVELLRGSTLREFVKERGRVLPEVAALIGIVLLDALGVAHAAGMVHRDVKPDNVMIDRTGRLVLTDFGLARSIDGDKLTRTGVLVGSPAYMAPEQARGEAVDERSDLFAAGAVLYELCTGRPPFVAKDALATALKVIEGRFDRPSRLNPQVSSTLERTITKMLAAAPQERYETAAEAQEALEQILRGVGIEQPRERLEHFFVAPGEANRGLVRQVVEFTLAAAERARSERRFAYALSCCDRILSLVPGEERATLLLKQLSDQRAWRRWGGVVLFFGAAATALYAALGASLFTETRSPDSGRLAVEASIPMEARAEASGTFVGPTREDLSARDRGSRDGVDAALAVDSRPRRPRRVSSRSLRPPGDAGSAPVVVDSRAPVKAKSPAISRKGRLWIEIGPWCDAKVDGRGVGRSPLAHFIELAPGRHQVRCGQPGGAVREEEVLIKPGEAVHLRGLLGRRVRVKLALKRGRALRVQGRVHRKGFEVPPRPTRVELLDEKGQTLEIAWISFGGERCTLVDTPRLSCH
ncbi:MAG: serine/threonine protein kinase [Deltaproteobacteria bacterium]|nr:serine/threonine protein kinase [Deltaproteobacteria bacterium]